jgi:hypothetical protein
VVGYEFQGPEQHRQLRAARDWCPDGQSIFVNSTTAVATTDAP